MHRPRLRPGETSHELLDQHCCATLRAVACEAKVRDRSQGHLFFENNDFADLNGTNLTARAS